MDDARAWGPDVSHHHPVLDFPSVLNAGATFFAAKATEGRSYRDPVFRQHRDGARAQPFELVIFYHYAKTGDPLKEAAHFLDVVGPLRDNERLALDVEGNDAPGVAWIDSFVSALPNDRRHLIYTSARIWRDVLHGPEWPRAIATDLWAPRYTDNPSDGPALPVDAHGFTVWPRWTFWQWRETFDCPGVAGGCDVNRFWGGVDELRAYAKLAGT